MLLPGGFSLEIVGSSSDFSLTSIPRNALNIIILDLL